MLIKAVQNGNALICTTWSGDGGPGENVIAHHLIDDDFTWVVGGHESVNNQMFRVEIVDPYSFTLRDWEHPTPPEEPGQVLAFIADVKKMWRVIGAAGTPIKITVGRNPNDLSVGPMFGNLDTVEVSHIEGNTHANGVFSLIDPLGDLFYLNDSESNGEYVPGTGWVIVTPLT